MDFGRAGLKDEEMGTVFQGDDVRVERLPLVGNDRDPAGGRELAGDVSRL